MKGINKETSEFQIAAEKAAIDYAVLSSLKIENNLCGFKIKSVSNCCKINYVLSISNPYSRYTIIFVILMK